jgi:hypothetical protein
VGWVTACMAFLGVIGLYEPVCIFFYCVCVRCVFLQTQDAQAVTRYEIQSVNSFLGVCCAGAMMGMACLHDGDGSTAGFPGWCGRVVLMRARVVVVGLRGCGARWGGLGWHVIRRGQDGTGMHGIYAVN